ncbi:MAG: DUF4174 domain-containing protein [Pseudomonadota bacterium]
MNYNLVVLLFVASAFVSAEPPPPLSDLAEMQWRYRIIVVQGDGVVEAYQQSLLDSSPELDERDVIWLLIDEDALVSNYPGPLADDLIVNIHRFYPSRSDGVLLIGKDGGVKARASTLETLDLFSLIDAMPMRRQEMQ